MKRDTLVEPAGSKKKEKRYRFLPVGASRAMAVIFVSEAKLATRGAVQ
jgi:hypothetical protein